MIGRVGHVNAPDAGVIHHGCASAGALILSAVHMAKFLTEMVCQRLDKDILDWNAQGAVAVLAAASLGLADAYPVGGAVASASKAFSIDKSLNEVNGVPVLGLPVRAETAGKTREHVRGQMRNADPR